MALFYEIECSFWSPTKVKALAAMDHLEKQNNTVVDFPVDIFPAYSFTLVVQDIELYTKREMTPAERVHGDFRIDARLRFELTDFLGNAHLEKFVMDPKVSMKAGLYKVKDFADFGLHRGKIRELLQRKIESN